MPAPYVHRLVGCAISARRRETRGSLPNRPPVRCRSRPSGLRVQQGLPPRRRCPARPGWPRGEGDHRLNRCSTGLNSVGLAANQLHSERGDDERAQETCCQGDGTAAAEGNAAGHDVDPEIRISVWELLVWTATERGECCSGFNGSYRIDCLQNSGGIGVGHHPSVGQSQQQSQRDGEAQ